MKVEFDIKLRYIIIADIIAVILIFVAGYVSQYDEALGALISGIILMFATIQFNVMSAAHMSTVNNIKNDIEKEDESKG